MAERVDSVGDLEENEESRSVRSSVETSSEDSEEEESDPRVKEEVGSIEIMALTYITRVTNIVLSVCGIILFINIHLH